MSNADAVQAMRDLARRLREVAKPTREMMLAVADEAMAGIWSRTVLEGKDMYGQNFPDYSTRRLYIGKKNDYYSTAAAVGRTERKPREGEKKARPVAKRDRTRTVPVFSRGKDGRLKVRDAHPVLKTRGGKDRKSAQLESVAFDGGWKEFKSALGHSMPDLMVSGRLLGSIGAYGYEVTESGESYVKVDFTRAREREIAKGLHEGGRFFWGYGLLPEEREKLLARAMEFVADRRARVMRGEEP